MLQTCSQYRFHFYFSRLSIKDSIGTNRAAPIVYQGWGVHASDYGTSLAIIENEFVCCLSGITELHPCQELILENLYPTWNNGSQALGTAKRRSKEEKQTTLMAPFRFKVTKDTYNDLKIQNKKGRIKCRKKHFQLLTGPDLMRFKKTDPWSKDAIPLSLFSSQGFSENLLVARNRLLYIQRKAVLSKSSVKKLLAYLINMLDG